DTLYLDAQGNANGVFVIKMNGALSTSTYSKVILINGAQSKNVYWKIEGAVGINNYSIFRGTIVCHNGALGALNTGVTLDGRALTTTGALTTTALSAVVPTLPSNCGTVDIKSFNGMNEVVTIYPNPFNTSISINNISQSNNIELKIYNVLGAEIMSKIITIQSTTLETSNLSTGIYYYKILDNTNKVIQSGKLIAQQ
ncbi:MAG TPA: ice-binding family protein, partial [Bacteroidia bacterium]|nr:ice-binding family protein [Bacteroidia bacterium]